MTINLYPKGFTYIPDFLTPLEEKNLMTHLEKLHWEDVSMYGVIAKRKVVHFGLKYTYNSRQVKPTHKIPDYLDKYINRAACHMHIPADSIKEILITKYPIGAGIGWHKDAKIFGNKIFGISIGSASVLKLRLKKDGDVKTNQIVLAPGSAYILEDQARMEWEHSIPPVEKLRYSITFRTLRSLT